jgi:hypothetical protein
MRVSVTNRHIELQIPIPAAANLSSTDCREPTGQHAACCRASWAAPHGMIWLAPLLSNETFLVPNLQPFDHFFRFVAMTPHQHMIARKVNPDKLIIITRVAKILVDVSRF